MFKSDSKNLPSSSNKNKANFSKNYVAYNLRKNNASKLKQESVDTTKSSKLLKKSKENKRCVVKIPRVPLQDKNVLKPTNSTKSTKQLQESNPKKYHVEFNLGDVSFTKGDLKSKANNLRENIKNKNKENAQEHSEQKILRSGRVFSPLSGNSKGNQEISLPNKIMKTAVEVYDFVPDNIDTNDRDTTSDVIEKIIKEGKATLVKHKHTSTTKKRTRSKSVSAIWNTIKRNILKTNVEFSKAEQIEKTKGIDNITSLMMDENGRNSNMQEDVNTIQVQLTEDTSNSKENFSEFRNASLENNNNKLSNKENVQVELGGNVLNLDGNFSELEYPCLQNVGNKIDYETNTKKENTGLLNPNKKIHVLEVIHLPPRVPEIPTTTRKQSLEKDYSVEDTELDYIRNATYLDFLSELGDKDDSSINDVSLLQANETTIQNFGKQNNDNVVNSVTAANNVNATNLDDSETTNALKDSIFPDVDVTPCFDMRARRRTYSRPKKSENFSRFFILLSDIGGDKKIDESADKNHESLIKEQETSKKENESFEKGQQSLRKEQESLEKEQETVFEKKREPLEKEQESSTKDKQHLEISAEIQTEKEGEQSKDSDGIENKENQPEKRNKIRKKRKIEVDITDLDKHKAGTSKEFAKFDEDKSDNVNIIRKRSRLMRM